MARVLKDALFTSKTGAKLLGPQVLEAGLFLKGKFLLQNWGVCVSAVRGLQLQDNPKARPNLPGWGPGTQRGTWGWCFVF